MDKLNVQFEYPIGKRENIERDVSKVLTEHGARSVDWQPGDRAQATQSEQERDQAGPPRSNR